MQIHYSPDAFKASKPVVTIGTFDGVHLGHQKVIDKMKELSSRCKGDTVLLSFSPHPRLVLGHAEGLKLLTTAHEKEQILSRTGINHYVVFPFTESFSKMNYLDFVKTFLVDKMNICTLVIGYDHRFGHNREGNYELLSESAKKYNFNIERLEALNVDQIEVSSTKIRHALKNGEIATANRSLGYPYMLTGQVVTGRQLGNKIGFPTANIRPPDAYKLIPGNGVYAVRVKHNNLIYKGMMNIGTRPTVNQNTEDKTMEVHILDFNDIIYGEDLQIEFIARLRGEKRFSSLEELKNQLVADRETVKGMGYE